MAKIYGLFGSMTGKLADTVMVVRNGVQISRRYQPIVANPQTERQVAARARLKLTSQLAAVVAPILAIPKQGNVSSRNLFTKVNYPMTSFASGTATVQLEKVQLTKSVVALPNLYFTIIENGVKVALNTNVQPDVTRVVYAVFERQADEKLRLVTSAVVETVGTAPSYFESEVLTIGNGNYMVYAYGMRDNTLTARTIFGDLMTPTATTVANIITTRTLTETDITLTETRGRALVIPAP